MPQQSSAALMTLDEWQQWEGRAVGGRYALQQHLGGSDHSAVYLTEFGGARAVVKLAPEDAPDAPAQLARWEAACNLAHPNLLRVYETGRWHADEEQDMFFAVMEHADENLSEVLVDRALTPAEAREMLTPTLAALEYLHGRNLVHGCLKPSNVMAVGPQLKLAIDGVRRSGTRLTSVEQEDWRAVPEVFNTGVSSRNDIWALGLLLVESLSRQKPKVEKSGEVAVQLPDDLPDPFRSIAQACLQREPAKRCSIAEIRSMLQRPIEPAKAPAQVVPIRPEPPQQTQPQSAEPATKPAKQEDTARAEPKPAETRSALSAPIKAVKEQPHDDDSRERDAAKATDLKFLLDEEAATKQPSKKVMLLAVAALVAIIAIVALLWNAGRPKPQTQPNAIAAEPASNPPAAQRTSASVSNPVVRPASAGVAHQVLPEVSRVAQNSIHGVVKVRVQVNVNEAGEVTLAGLAAHGPSRYFAKQALDAARQWTFTAPVVDGKPVASRWMLQFEFRRSGVKAESRMVQPKA